MGLHPPITIVEVEERTDTEAEAEKYQGAAAKHEI